MPTIILMESVLLALIGTIVPIVTIIWGRHESRGED